MLPLDMFVGDWTAPSGSPNNENQWTPSPY